MTSKPSLEFSHIRYVFLDRDGVINRKAEAGGYITRWDDFEILPGVEEAIAALNRSGRKVIVVTNQRGIALGLYSRDDLDVMHGRLAKALAKHDAHLDGIYVCPHNSGECDCRKPLTGLFDQAFRDFPDARAANSLMVGDSLSDVEGGLRAGMPTVFISDDDDATSHDKERAIGLAQLYVSSLAELVEKYFAGGTSRKENRHPG